MLYRNILIGWMLLHFLLTFLIGPTEYFVPEYSYWHFLFDWLSILYRNIPIGWILLNILVGISYLTGGVCCTGMLLFAEYCWIFLLAFLIWPTEYVVLERFHGLNLVAPEGSHARANGGNEAAARDVPQVGPLRVCGRRSYTLRHSPWERGADNHGWCVLQSPACLNVLSWNIPIDRIVCTGLFTLTEYFVLKYITACTFCTGISLLSECFVLAYPSWLNILYWDIPPDWIFWTRLFLMTEYCVLKYPSWLNIL